MFEGTHMFSGRDPEHRAYRSRAHLASIISKLGPPPPELISRGRYSSKFFSDGEHLGIQDSKQHHERYGSDVNEHRLTSRHSAGSFNAGIDLPPVSSLEETETNLEGRDK